MKVWAFLSLAIVCMCLGIAVAQKEEPQPNPQCPTGASEDVVHPVHLTYPGNCAKFYKCLKGLAYPHDCPGGLYWSLNEISCTWPGKEMPLCQY